MQKIGIDLIKIASIIPYTMAALKFLDIIAFRVFSLDRLGWCVIYLGVAIVLNPVLSKKLEGRYLPTETPLVPPASDSSQPSSKLIGILIIVGGLVVSGLFIIPFILVMLFTGFEFSVFLLIIPILVIVYGISILNKKQPRR